VLDKASEQPVAHARATLDAELAVVRERVVEFDRLRHGADPGELIRTQRLRGRRFPNGNPPGRPVVR
jgi:hypothetical protein